MPANCDSCRHHVGPEMGADRRRECHATAPVFAREVSTPAYGPFPVFLACWPLTLPSDGCGDWSGAPDQSPAASPGPDPAAAAPKEPRGRKGK